MHDLIKTPLIRRLRHRAVTEAPCRAPFPALISETHRSIESEKLSQSLPPLQSGRWWKLRQGFPLYLASGVFIKSHITEFSRKT